MRTPIALLLLLCAASHIQLSAQSVERTIDPPFRSNGFFVSYSVGEFYGTGELETRQEIYGCSVHSLTQSMTLCDTSWVLEWWEAQDSVELDIPAIVRDFESLPGITVTPNYVYRLERGGDDPVANVETPYIMPNDSLFPLQWHMQVDQIDMPYAWKKTRGSPEVIIGILDTGVWYGHEDLQANLRINPGEDTNGDGIIQPEERNGIDDDFNLYVDDFYGWDWYEDDNDPSPPLYDPGYHGTKVAGVSCATANNFIGVAGIGWNCRYLPMRAGYGGYVYLEYIIPAMFYSLQQGIDVLNCSWYNYVGNDVLYRLVECLYEHECVVVACAGNDNTQRHAYPASYEYVVAVAGTDQEKSLTSFTNYGDWIHIAAPGVEILTTSAYTEDWQLEASYVYADGTSFSTPMVSGAAALMRTLKPNWDAQAIIQRLYATADPVNDEGDPPPDRTIDGGVLNVYEAVDLPRVVKKPDEQLE